MRQLIAALLVAVFFCASAARTDSSVSWVMVEDRWYELSFGGSPCGFSHNTLEKDGDRLRTTNQMRMKLGRGATPVTVEVECAFIETANGDPVEARVRLATGGPANVTTYRFVREGKAWAVDLSDGGKPRHEQVPSGSWLTPQAVDRFIDERMKAGAKEIKFSALDIQGTLQVASIAMTKTADEMALLSVGAEKREIPVTVWSIHSDLLPVPTIDRYSSDGQIVDSIQKLGLGEIRSRLVDEKTAKEALAKGSVEVLVRSFVPAKRRIPGARERDRLVFKVTTHDGDLPELPSAGSQRVRRVAPNELEVEVDIRRESDATKEEFDDPKYRMSTALIDSDSKEVREMLEKVGPRSSKEGSQHRADELRRFVGRWISDKNLASALASASEAARSHAGDCSEHGVLLAALLRADGIPSRVASGLVYADSFGGEKNVWAWHVWTQALIEKRGGGYGWLDVDATLPTRFDAAHLLTGVSDLAGGATDPMWLTSLGLIGNISIEVTQGDTQQSAEPNRTPAQSR